MADKGGIMSKVVKALNSVGIKAPWRYTGPLSSPEFLNHLPKATEYRAVAPASQALRPSVPQAENDRIYDIKYYVRDSRRAHLPGGSIKMVRAQYDTTAKDEALEAMEVPPTHNKTHRWSKPRSILEQDNNGYTL